MKTLIINCSYQAKGDACDLAFAIKNNRFLEADVAYLPNVLGCFDCSDKTCSMGVGCCKLTDKLSVLHFLKRMLEYDNIVFVTPVYLNMPTPKLMAFLTRLNTYNDVNGRNLFENQTAYIACIADVSGTQQTASVLMNALNMLGFNFRGKCILEHINEWKTAKVRGGFLREDVPYIDNREGN